MIQHIARRLLDSIPTLIGVSVLTFVLMRLPGGDPVRLLLGPEAKPEAIEAATRQYGFDQHLVIQYFYMMWALLTGTLQSITHQRPVIQLLAERLPDTIELAVAAMFFATLTGAIVGTVSAVWRGGVVDNVSRFVVFVFLAMPGFWLGLELIILFARELEWFPPAGRGAPFTTQWLSHLVLPALTLGVGTGAFLSRILRSSMLEVLQKDFVRTARAKGLDEPTVILKHALRNALIPFVTVAGLATGAMLGGAVIVEYIYNWPGVGRLLYDSIRQRDFPVTMGTTLLLAVVFMLVNLGVDILYTMLDPRIRLDGGRE